MHIQDTLKFFGGVLEISSEKPEGQSNLWSLSAYSSI